MYSSANFAKAELKKPVSESNLPSNDDGPAKTQKKKTVAFILPSLCTGGAERVLITLMNHLDRTRFNPVFFALIEDGPSREWVKGDIPINVLEANSVRHSYFRLLNRLKRVKPDIVVTTMVHSNSLSLLLKPFFPKTKFIIRESSMPSALTRDFYGWKGKLCNVAYNYLYPFADAVISPSMKIVEDFKYNFKVRMKNHIIVHNPVDEDTIRVKLPEQFEAEAKSGKLLRFVCIGRLAYEKGYDRLIETLVKQEPSQNWRLDILGEGPEREKLQALILANDLQEHVFLQGYQDNPWVTLARADALILSSRWEGMPNVVLEALACGTKVLAMKEAGGIIEIDSMTPIDALQVFDTIDALTAHLVALKPANKRKPAASLLPEAFQLPTIMRKFQRILNI